MASSKLRVVGASILIAVALFAVALHQYSEARKDYVSRQLLETAVASFSLLEFVPDSTDGGQVNRGIVEMDPFLKRQRIDHKGIDILEHDNELLTYSVTLANESGKKKWVLSALTNDVGVCRRVELLVRKHKGEYFDRNLDRHPHQYWGDKEEFTATDCQPNRFSYNLNFSLDVGSWGKPNIASQNTI